MGPALHQSPQQKDIPMPTPDEARSAVDAAREDLNAAFAEAVGAWQRKPEGSEGEDAWSPQEVAAHVLGTEIFFARAVCQACGYDGPRNPIKGALLATPQEAQHALTLVSQAADAKMKHVTVEDFAKQHETMGSVEDVFGVWAGHLRDHATQIRAAAAS